MIDPRHVGRKYGPFRYVAGLEEIRDFAVVLAGGTPGRVFDAPPPSPPHAAYLGTASAPPIAPPTFCVRFAMKPFAAACADPALGIDLARLLHGEQAFDFGAPVRPGDELTTTGEIVAIREKPGLDVLTVRTETVNARGERVVIATWTAVVKTG